jgi:hypothetical protein
MELHDSPTWVDVGIISGCLLNHVAVHPLLELQRTIGNQAVLNLLHAQNTHIDASTQAFREPRFGHDFSQIPIHSTHTAAPQTKLKVNQPGDMYEQEADQVAEQVMRMPDSETVQNTRSSGHPSPLPIQRLPPESEQVHRQPDEEEEEEALQAKEAPGHTPTVTPELQARIHSLRGGGQPLDAATRAFMEPRFGHDFSQVRVHTDEQSAQSINAVAYTVGNNIIFGAGQYAPDATIGRRLLAHELTHTIQQSIDGLAVQRQTPPNVPKGKQAAIAQVGTGRIISEGVVGNKVVIKSVVDIPPGRLGYEKLLPPGVEVGLKGWERAHSQGNITGAESAQGIRYAPSEVNQEFQKLGIEQFISDLNAQKASGVTIYLTTETESHPGTLRLKSIVYKVEAAHGTEKPTRLFEAGLEIQNQTTTPRVTPSSERYGDIESFLKPIPARTAGTPPPTETPTPSAAPTKPESEPNAPPVTAKVPPKTQGDVEPSSGTPPTATKASGGAGAQSEHESGETKPATGGAGGASQVGLHIGLGAASVGLSLLAGYLKKRVDAKIVQKQIDALLHVAGQQINAHPDEALKKMMFAPEVTTYAWVFLNSSVITFFEANTGPEPTTSDSAPMIGIDSIDYAYQPVDPSIPQNFLSGISGGGRHLTTTRTLIIDIPLVTPSVEDMFEYAKAHNIWLGGLLDYVMYRLQKSLVNFQIAVSDLELHQGTQKDIDRAKLQNRYWQDLADRILAAEKKQTASAR